MWPKVARQNSHFVSFFVHWLARNEKATGKKSIIMKYLSHQAKKSLLDTLFAI